MPDQTPKLGLPFPLPPDPVVDYPALGRSLAELLDGLVPILARSNDSPADGIPTDGTMVEAPSGRPRLTLPVAGNYLAFAFAHVGASNAAGPPGIDYARPSMGLIVISGSATIGNPQGADINVPAAQYAFARTTLTIIATVENAAAGTVLGLSHGFSEAKPTWNCFLDIGRLLGAVPIGSTPVPAAEAPAAKPAEAEV